MKKINKLKSFATFLLAAITLISCGGVADDNAGDYVDPTYNPFGKYEETVTIKGVMEYLTHNDSRVPASITPDNQKYIQFLKNDLNINFEYMWKVPPQQYENKLAGSILSKHWPDILKVNASQYQDFKKKGMLKNLSEAIKFASPTVKEFLNRDPEVLKSLTDADGKIYAIPQYDNPNRDVPVMFYRKDWLEDLKLDVPTTPDQLLNVLRQFKAKKGAVNGIATAKDLTAAYFSLDRYTQMFGYQPFTWNKDANGNIVSADTSDNAKQAIKFLNTLYSEGLLAKDYAATDAAMAESALKSGKSGVVFGPWWTYEYPIGDLMNEQDWGSAPIPHQPGTKIVVERQKIASYYVVTKNCKNPEALLKMINMYIELDGKDGAKPEDGYVWSWCPTQFYDPYDIEETYVKINKQLETDPTASSPAPDGWTSHEQKLWKAYPNYLVWKEDHGAIAFESNNFANIIGRVNTDGAWAAIRQTASENRYNYNEYYGLPTVGQSKFGGQISTTTEVYFAKVIAGLKNLNEDWNSYVSEWGKLGGTQITQEVNDWYKVNGFKEA